MEIQKVENPIQVIVSGMSAKADELIKKIQKSKYMEFLSDNFLILSQVSTIPASAIIVDFDSSKRNLPYFLDLSIDSILNGRKRDILPLKNELRNSLGNVLFIENLEESLCEDIIESINFLHKQKLTSMTINLPQVKMANSNS